MLLRVLTALSGVVLLLLASGQFLGPITGGDAPYFEAGARNLLAVGSYALRPGAPTLFRPPGYSAFLAAVYSLSAAPELVRGVQLLLLACTALLLARLARPWWPGPASPSGAGRHAAPVARLSALLCVTYLPLAWMAVQHLSETLLTFLCVAATLLLGRLPRGRGAAVAAGLVCGAAVLTRPVLLLLPLPALVLGLRPHPGSTVLAALSLGLVTLPWAIRNHQVAGVWTLGCPGVAVYQSARQYDGTLSYQMRAEDWERFTPDWSARQARWEQRLPLARAEYAADQEMLTDARRIMRSVPPLTYLRHLLPRVAALWGVGSNTPGWFHRLAQAQWLLYTPLVLLGLWLERRRLGAQWPLWWPAVFLTGLHLYFHVEARYTFPARPLLLVYAAVALIFLLDQLKHRRRQMAGAGA